MPIDKALEEWTVIRYFREKYTSFPKGKLIKSESPDFILKLNKKKRIGIELTRLDHAGSGAELLSELLQKKDDKFRLYKKQLLNEYWLIISAESGNLEEILECAGRQASSFNKVFLFDMFSGKIEKIT